MKGQWRMAQEMYQRRNLVSHAVETVGDWGLEIEGKYSSLYQT